MVAELEGAEQPVTSRPLETITTQRNHLLAGTKSHLVIAMIRALHFYFSSDPICYQGFAFIQLQCPLAANKLPVASTRSSF